MYLPGVSRSELRAVDTCPPELAPIAELQYRSQWFSHPNNRDWTVRALLTNRERGLGLRIADDADTSTALLLALDRLLDEPVDRLAKQVLDADFFHELVNPDPVRSLLGWLDDPHGFQTRARRRAVDGVRPAVQGRLRLRPDVPTARSPPPGSSARAQGQWAKVWKRFAETPERYPGIPDQLRQARPDELIVENVDAWPQDNEAAEDQLRNRLRDFAVLTPEGARKEVARARAEHAWRRGTVWADLDRRRSRSRSSSSLTLAELTAHAPR